METIIELTNESIKLPEHKYPLGSKVIIKTTKREGELTISTERIGYIGAHTFRYWCGDYYSSGYDAYYTIYSDSTLTKPLGTYSETLIKKAGE